MLLIALGYTMVYGIIELINFAHGEIYMIGAFTALIVTGVLTLLGWNHIAILVLAALAAVVYSSAYGYTIEKIAYKPPAQCTAAVGPDQCHRGVAFFAETMCSWPRPRIFCRFRP